MPEKTPPGCSNEIRAGTQGYGFPGTQAHRRPGTAVGLGASDVGARFAALRGGSGRVERLTSTPAHPHPSVSSADHFGWILN
ncbi:hypothetical protein HMPREF9440_00676 [Sutterella parvirubra YIT 11816]|uniref:Uncharacterized protein n=1 Tax=Sutterella parvirubra YIT 11816 TaxID=762967 RepID=H3KD70_9BURK|nr:hypothetical protein HMPREF9440_00676 [Sutterella parvirubra YIT 11816]